MLQRPQSGAPQSTLVRTVRKMFAAMRIRFEPEPDVCPTAAFEPDELTWPRVVRRASRILAYRMSRPVSKDVVPRK